jgi:hypothetical protein
MQLDSSVVERRRRGPQSRQRIGDGLGADDASWFAAAVIDMLRA